MENNRQVKQFIVIRTDLEMSMGKTAAQASHAAMKVFFDRMCGVATMSSEDGMVGTLYEIFLTEEEVIWKEGLFTKIVKKVKNETQLLKLYEEVKASGLNVSLIKDAALTELKEPAYTAIAIGPNYVDRIEPHVKRLQNL
jgi:PTH2 family peptidyl-tRNA hydrolase